jgi:Mg-chelatase subunit ChlD
VSLDIVLVIDRSGSMGKAPLSGGQFRIYWAKLAADNLVDQLAGPGGSLSPHRVAVISFAGDATATLHLALNAGTTAAAVKSAINSITTGGSTYIAPALTKATDQLHTFGRADAQKVVILLSDGRNWANSGHTPDAATRRANTVSAIGPLHLAVGATGMVFSIGIGTDGPDFSDLDVPLLQQIATAPGQYIHATDASTLPDIFLDIIQGIDVCLPSTAPGG